MRRLPVFLLACIAGAAGHASPLATQCSARAMKLTDTLAAGDYAAANAQLGVTMRIMFSPEQLQANWEALADGYGAYRSHGDPSVPDDDGKDVVVHVPLAFAHGRKTLLVGCSANGDGDIASLAFL